MTAEELWEMSGLSGTYEAWPFGDAPDKLADLVMRGVKTATCSAYDLYLAENAPIPREGDYSVILDSMGAAVCVIRTTRVYVTAFDQVPGEHAWKEGEGDRSLDYWRKVHIAFLTRELASINQVFTEKTKVVCEEFEVVYNPFSPNIAMQSLLQNNRNESGQIKVDSLRRAYSEKKRIKLP